MADISNNIKRLRSSQGVSQTQLAEAIGVTRQTVSNWEKGISYPDARMLEQLANALHCQMDELLYPASAKKSSSKSNSPFPFGFVIISVIVYFFLFWVIGIIFILPLFKKIFGGNIEQEPFLLIYWGLILLVAYIAICFYQLTNWISSREEQGDDKSKPNIIEDILNGEENKNKQ